MYANTLMDLIPLGIVSRLYCGCAWADTQTIISESFIILILKKQ